MNNDFRKQVKAAVKIIGYKIQNIALSNEKYQRAGLFEEDFVSEEILYGSFSNNVVKSAVDECCRRGYFYRVIKIDCPSCDTPNIIPDLGGETENEIKAEVHYCSFCRETLAGGDIERYVTIHPSYRLKDEGGQPDDTIYYNLDKEEEEFQEMRNNVHFLAKLVNWMKQWSIFIWLRSLFDSRKSETNEKLLKP